jgi:hypothetical protein
VFERLIPPEFEVAMYLSFEREMVKHLEQRRLAQSETTRRPRVADRLLLIAGNALIAVGQWIRARSVAADLIAYAGER